MKRSVKGFSLVELITVTTVVAVLSAVGLISYRIYIKKAVISALKSAVMVNVELIQAHYDINGYWVTDDPDNENLTTAAELESAGLVTRNWSGEFIMRVFLLVISSPGGWELTFTELQKRTKETDDICLISALF